jgi:hypothetical protein
LLAIKWHTEKNKSFWHWVVFTGDSAGACILDSKKTLRRHRRTDFGRMKPKWYIEVRRSSSKPDRSERVRGVARAFGWFYSITNRAEWVGHRVA